MYYKLVDDCIRFQTMGIEMLGNPRTQLLIGLDEAGSALANRLLVGCEVDIAHLSESEQALMDALTKMHQFTSCEQTQTIRSVYFHVTARCNMHCPGCYSEADRDSKADLPFADMTKIIDNIAGAHIRSLVISGGEPFLRKDIILLLKYMKQIAKIPNLLCITNGLADFDTYINACKYVDVLAFSLDGHDQASSFFRRDTHNKVVDMIKKLINAGCPVSIIFTLHKRNLSNYQKMIALAATLGVEYNFSVFTTAHSEVTAEFEFTAGDMDNLEEALAHDHSSLNDTAISAKIGCRDCCGAGSLELSITANGDIFPCHMFFEEKFLLGNALTDCLDTVFLDQRPMFDVDRKNECQKCEYRYICGGGCLYRSFAVRGHLEDTDPLCPINASHIKQALSGLIG